MIGKNDGFGAKRCAVTAVSIALTMGCTQADQNTALVDQEIVGGSSANDRTAVVAIVSGDLLLCSATLIHPRVILTAAHCLPPNLSVPRDQLEVVFDFDISQRTETRRLVTAVAHPSWNEARPGNDVGVASLDGDAPVPAMVYGTAPLDDTNIGQQVELVGYGITSKNGRGDGIRRKAVGTITVVETTTFDGAPSPGITCNGDSGGPAIVNRNGVDEVVGINSRSTCTDRFIEERPDAHADTFITPFVAAAQAATCDTDGHCATGCEQPDPDCPCAADGLCTASCADSGRDSDCPAECAADGVCLRQGCPHTDTDCPLDCTGDDVCDTRCDADNADPDCSCAKDDFCSAACDEDPDCTDGDGGCTSAPSASLLLGLLLWAATRRQHHCS